MAPPIVAPSRMIAAGTRKSFVDSHSTSGMTASTSSTPRRRPRAAQRRERRRCAADDDDERHDGESEEDGIADEAPRDGLHLPPQRAQRELLGDGGVRDLGDDDALDDHAERHRGEAEDDAGDRRDGDRTPP